MEDCSVAFEDKLTKSCFFAIFDGHGSDERLEELAVQMLQEK